MTLQRYVSEAELFQSFAESDAVPDFRLYAILLGLAPKQLYLRLQRYLARHPARKTAIKYIKRYM